MRRTILLLACTVLLVLASCSGNKSASEDARVAKAHPDRKAAPGFTLTDASGSKVSLADYRGKVVLLNFWATWCGPCELEIPWFKEFEQQYKSKGFEVLGVSMDEDGWSAIKPFIASHQMNYRVVLGDDSVSQLYGGLDALPTTFLIDRDGKLAFAPHIGLISKEEYVKEIQGLISEGSNGNAPSSARLHATVPAVLLSGATE